MTTTQDTLSLVRAYHRSWTSRDFDAAAALLAPDLRVEVPVNDYPDGASFADAVRGFGSMVSRTELVSELAGGDEAMLLYDMEVRGLGSMRIAEHFTVSGGKITRLRQIHDTAALRTA